MTSAAVPAELLERIRRVELVLVDNDGVMTDGRLIYGDHGDEIKFFDVQDGFGMVMLRRAALKTVILSARKSRLNDRRAKELQVMKLYQNAFDKSKVFQKILKKFKVSPEQVCYVGDDLIDIPVLKRVGFAVAVQNARLEVKKEVHWVTEHSGGRGALRELAELILKTQGKWADVTARYYL